MLLGTTSPAIGGMMIVQLCIAHQPGAVMNALISAQVLMYRILYSSGGKQTQGMQFDVLYKLHLIWQSSTLLSGINLDQWYAWSCDRLTSLSIDTLECGGILSSTTWNMKHTRYAHGIHQKCTFEGYHTHNDACSVALLNAPCTSRLRLMEEHYKRVSCC